MRAILVLGAGKIGRLIATLFSSINDYQVYLGDLRIEDPADSTLQSLPSSVIHLQVDASDPEQIIEVIRQHEIRAVVSALPFYCNVSVAQAAKGANVAYFDLTEDIAVTQQIAQLAKGSSAPFVPQCGLAPGFISIVANELMGHFDSVETVHLRVGALPVHPNNALKYSLTWSTDGLINEYGNICHGIVNGELTPLQPLEGLETVEIDGSLYEAFNTSGGCGSLAETAAGKVNTLNYKTLRYPGHRDMMRLLMVDLKLNDDRETLRRMLENAIPKTMQDVVIVYVNVQGRQKGDLYTETFVRKVYPKTIAGHLWSAIQVTTAASLCAVVDLVLSDSSRYAGFVEQERIDLSAFLANRFGQHYETEGAAHG